MYEFTEVRHYSVSASELEEILKEVHNLSYRPGLAVIYEVGGDDSGGTETYDVAKNAHWDDGDIPDLSCEWDWPPFDEVLEDLASRDLIPEGSYLIEYCWG
jgi:hypothetical protein